MTGSCTRAKKIPVDDFPYKIKSFGKGKGNDARIVIRLRSSAQEIHACVPKRHFDVQARNRRTLNETGFVTVTFACDHFHGSRVTTQRMGFFSSLRDNCGVLTEDS